MVDYNTLPLNCCLPEKYQKIAPTFVSKRHTMRKLTYFVTCRCSESIASFHLLNMLPLLHFWLEM
jgi:hypothetical protein